MIRYSTLNTLKRFFLWCLVVWAGLVSAPVGAQSLPAAADASRLWLLIPEADQPDIFNIYHHAYTGPAGELSKVQTLRGEVRPHGVAARDDSLWIFYPDGTVQAIQAQLSVLQDSWIYEARVEPRLPTGVSVRDTVLTDAGPWVLVRIEDAQTLDRIDQASKPKGPTERSQMSRRLRNLAIGLPPDHGLDDQDNEPANGGETPEGAVDENEAGAGDTAEDDQGAANAAAGVDPAADVQASDAAPAPSAVALPVDRLLTLRNGRWVAVTLPEDWPHGAAAWLVADRAGPGPPTLVSKQGQGRRPGRDSVRVYRDLRDTPPTWTSTVYPLSAEAEGVSLLAVQGQLVLAEHTLYQGQLSAKLSALRDGKAFPIGEMTLDDVRPTRWRMLGTGQAAAMIAQRADPMLADTQTDTPAAAWARMDMRGQSVLEPTDLIVKTPSRMDEFVQYAMLGFVVLLITVLMMAFWRRDAAWNRLDLPPTLVVADLPRRAAAAAIDLAPGLLGAMYYFDLNVDELLLRWPGNGIAQTGSQMLPGTVVILLFVTHTTVTELVIARTLGKALTGLRTTTLAGERPRAWQLLIRGMLKCLDLLPGAWLLLMLPVIAPHRQRLGDLVGRTVVVCDAPPVESEDQEDAGQDDPL